MKRLLGLVGFIAVAILITTVIVIYAMGYRPNLSNRTIQATGVVSIKTTPQGARVFIDGKQYEDTDVDIPNLSPGNHILKISKEGYADWEKTIIVSKERVNILQMNLFKLAPTLRPATSIGVLNPVYFQRNNRVFFQTTTNNQQGIWSLTLNGNNFAAFFSRELNKIAADSSELEFSKANFEISPNGSQLLVNAESKYVLLDSNKLNEKPQIISENQWKKLSEDWVAEKNNTSVSQAAALGQKAQETATGLSTIVFSPDKTKFFGTRGDGNLVVFDSETSVYSNLDDQFYVLPPAKSYTWHPDNNHLFVLEDSGLSVQDLNGENKISLFTGTVNSNLMAVWPDGSKVGVLTNFNKTPESLPNIYAIELR